jgi:hypothetical protein
MRVGGWVLVACATLVGASVALTAGGCKRGPAPGSREQAAGNYARYCASCHGETGRGDGFSGRGLTPPPQNFHDPNWLKATSDAEIDEAIARGGAGVGKSVAMPPNPQIAADPEELAGMRRFVRELGMGR